jgi:hypothetical protein
MSFGGGYVFLAINADQSSSGCGRYNARTFTLARYRFDGSIPMAPMLLNPAMLMVQRNIWPPRRLDHVARIKRHVQDVRQRGLVPRRANVY